MLVLSAAGEKAKPDSGEKNGMQGCGLLCLQDSWELSSHQLSGRGCGGGGDEKTKQPCDLSYLYLESHRMSQIYSEG